MTKEQIIQELARLYSLRDGGKSVDRLIRELEHKLFVVLYTEPKVQQGSPPGVGDG